MRSIWASILSSFGAKAYGALIELLSLLVTARLLGADGRGIVATVLVWSGLFANLFGLSLHQVIIYRLSGQGTHRLIRVFSALVPVSIVLCLLAWSSGVLLYIGGWLRPVSELSAGLLVMGMVLVPVVMWEAYVNHMLSAAGRLRYYNTGQLIGRTIGFTVMLAAILLFDSGAGGAVLGNLAALSIILLIGLIGLKGVLEGPWEFSRQEVRALVSGGVKLHINTIGAFLLMQVDILMLGQMSGMVDVGWYQASVQLIGAPLMLSAAVSLVLYSRISELGPIGAWGIHRKLIGQVMLIYLGVAVVGYLIAPVLIPALLGDDFSPAVPVFRILLIAMLGMGFSQLMVVQWIAHGLFLQAGAITILVGLANITLNLIYIPKYGMYAAAWTTVAAFMISIITNAIFAFRIERRWVLKTTGS